MRIWQVKFYIVQTRRGRLFVSVRRDSRIGLRLVSLAATYLAERSDASERGYYDEVGIKLPAS